jgi:hypothetical protein
MNPLPQSLPSAGALLARPLAPPALPLRLHRHPGRRLRHLLHHRRRHQRPAPSARQRPRLRAPPPSGRWRGSRRRRRRRGGAEAAPLRTRRSFRRSSSGALPRQDSDGASESGLGWRFRVRTRMAHPRQDSDGASESGLRWRFRVRTRPATASLSCLRGQPAHDTSPRAPRVLPFRVMGRAHDPGPGGCGAAGASLPACIIM